MLAKQVNLSFWKNTVYTKVEYFSMIGRECGEGDEKISSRAFVEKKNSDKLWVVRRIILQRTLKK